MPNFFIDNFRIPPFLLSIYQAAGIQYDVPWQVLAGINEIETDYGRNLNVSSAGAVGWMQFLPSTFRRYGVDANGDGVKDPYNPVDAIFSAARYLHAAGASRNLRSAIFAYNHAGWYVDSVLLRARLIGGLPAGLVGSLTGLTQGHFPVAAKARYADDIREQQLRRRVRSGNAAVAVNSDPSRKAIDVYARRGAPVIAVNDGRIVRLGRTRKLGRFVVLQDVYGNAYRYAHLGSVAKRYPVPKRTKPGRSALALPESDRAPRTPASAGRHPQAKAATVKHATRGHATRRRVPARRVAARASAPVRQERLFANPARPGAYRAGGARQLAGTDAGGGGAVGSLKRYFAQTFGLSRRDLVLRRLRAGSRVIGGTILGRIGHTNPARAPHVSFAIRPAGANAPLIDPKPVLDGWELLASTAIYRAAGRNPFFGPGARNPTIGQVLLMSKEELQRRVLADPRISIYPCGQTDIRQGLVDRRVLATLEFLVASGLDPTVSSLQCGHSRLTTSGNVSEHSTGDAVDVAKVNGIPILGHQGPGSITDITIRRLLTLQGALKPHQIISLMTYPGTPAFALPDHYNHIHVGYHPLFGANTKLGRQIGAILKPHQWIKLIGALNKITEPVVNPKPSKYAIKDRPTKHHNGD